MIHKIITTAARILTVWMAAEAIRGVWKEIGEEEKKEEKKEEK